MNFQQAYENSQPYKGAVRIRRIFGHKGLRYVAVACVAFAVLALAASLHAFRITEGMEFPYRALVVFFATAASMCIGGQLYAISNENRRGAVRFYDAEVILKASSRPTLHSFMQTKLMYQTLARLGLDQHEQKRISESYSRYRINPSSVVGEDVVLGLISSCDPIITELQRRGVQEQLPKALWWARKRFDVLYEARRWWSREKLRRIPSLGSFLDRRHLATLKRYTHAAWEEKGYSGIEHRLPLYSKAVRAIESAMLAAKQKNVLVVSDDPRAAFDAVIAFAAYVEQGKIDSRLEGNECYVIEEDNYVHDIDAKRYERIQAMVQEVAQVGGAILLLKDLDVLVESFYQQGQEALITIGDSLASAHVPVLATAGTINFYRTLDPNISLLSYFDVVEIDIDDEADARGFLEDAIVIAETRYDVIVTVGAIDEMLRLSKRLHPAFSPSFAALELFDDIVPELMKTERFVIDTEDIRGWFKDKSPVETTSPKQIQAELDTITETLAFRVLGQEAAIEEIVTVLRSTYAGLRRDDRPMASFIFFGPLGSGKAAAAKAIASALFDDRSFEDIDLSAFVTPAQFIERIGTALGTSSRIFSFSGADRASASIRAAVVDLIEGRTSVKNTSDAIIIVNVSIDDTEFFKTRHSVHERVAALEKIGISKEFADAFDAIVAFTPLSVDSFKSLVMLSTRAAADRLAGKGITLEVTPTLVDHLTRSLYDERYGARELDHSVARSIEDPVARALLSGSIRKGDTIELVSGSESSGNPGLIAKIR